VRLCLPEPSSDSGLAALLHVANFHWYDCHNQQARPLWFPTSGQCVLVLSLEEQFYLLFPF
jgi:hypothetical protein